MFAMSPSSTSAADTPEQSTPSASKVLANTLMRASSSGADVAAVADAAKLVVDVDGLALQGALHAAVRHDHDVLAHKALGDVVLLGKPAHGHLGVDALAFLGGNAEGDGLVAPAAVRVQRSLSHFSHSFLGSASEPCLIGCSGTGART